MTLSGTIGLTEFAFAYHSLGKTGRVLFQNACIVSAIIQRKGVNCEGKSSGMGVDVIVILICSMVLPSNSLL